MLFTHIVVVSVYHLLSVLHWYAEIGLNLHVSRAVLTNGHTAHVPKAPRFFFLFDVPPTGCVNFFKLIILLPSQRSIVRETR